MSEYNPWFLFLFNNEMIIRKLWYQEHAKEGYEFIKTPIILNEELLEKIEYTIKIKQQNIS